VNRLLRSLVVLAALVLAGPARADELRPGYLELSQRDTHHWRMIWKAPVLGGLATRARPAIPDFCTQTLPVARVEGAALIAESALTCGRNLAGSSIGLAGMETAFTDALLRIAPLGQPVQAARLTPRQPRTRVATRASAWGVGRTYLGLGFTHILFGWDHLLFVVALVLLVGGWRRLVATVTAFTAAHSITLAATTLGWVTVARKPVEICIALSIVLVAREILRPPEAEPTLARRTPALIAFCFGLLHGFGFAAALAEIGLPHGEIPLALFAFNIGVELGQLAIVGATLVAVATIARFAAMWQRPAAIAGAYAIGAVASAWLIQRTFA
jgi:hydrogenase/urease accessory protein HupE